MSFQIELPENRSIQLRFDEQLSLAEFEDFCSRHPELLVEREPDGQLTVRSPVHLLSGGQESDVGFYLNLFVKPRKLGRVYSPSTGFALPDGSLRSADAAFVSTAQLAQLAEAEKHRFARLVPELVIEIRSDTGKLGKLLTKMRDTWIGNGVRLAWLIDPKNRVSYIYRADGSEEIVTGFDKVLDGEDLLPGFGLELAELEV